MFLSNELMKINVMCSAKCHLEFAMIILLTHEFINKTKASDNLTIIDIDAEFSEIYKINKTKTEKPSVFQNDAARIVGGQSTTIDKYPFIVSLQLIGESHLCGGSIINTLWVISASHCITECDTDPCTYEYVKDPSDFQIVAGTSDAKPNEYGQVREIEKFVKHPGFSRLLLHDDIALIKVKNKFTFTKTVQSIILPQLSELGGNDLSETYKECIALGWGAQKPKRGKFSIWHKYDTESELAAPILMVVSLPTIPIKLCKELINEEYITKRHVCTMYQEGGKDACDGDSGGPLVCGGILHGVTSWGHGCARLNTPGVFTRVDTYKGWIENILSGGPNVDNYYGSSIRTVFLKWILCLGIFLNL